METLGSKLTSSEALESITAANNKQIGPRSNMRHATRSRLDAVLHWLCCGCHVAHRLQR